MTTPPEASVSSPAGGAHTPIPYLPTASLIIVVVAVIGSVVDIILAKGAFDVILGENEFLSAVVATGIALVSVSIAVSGGIAIRRGHRSIGIVIMLSWLAIGVALAVMRWNRGTLDGDLENDGGDKILAIIMLAVFIAAGVEITDHGSRILAADAYLRTRSSRRAVARLARRRTAVVAQYGRVGLGLREFGEKRARAARQHDLAQNTIDELERELMAFARDRIAEALRDPAKTGLIRQPLAGEVTRDGVDASAEVDLTRDDGIGER